MYTCKRTQPRTPRPGKKNFCGAGGPTQSGKTDTTESRLGLKDLYEGSTSLFRDSASARAVLIVPGSNKRTYSVRSHESNRHEQADKQRYQPEKI